MENSIGDVTSDNTGCQKIVRTVPQNGIVYHHLNQKFKAGENDLIVAANKDDVTYTGYNAEDMPTRPDMSMESKCSDEVGLEVSSNPVSAENCIQVLNIVETKSLNHVRIAPEVEPSNEVGCNLVCDGNHKASPLNEDCANSHLANDVAILPALHSLTLDESSAALADPTAVTEADIVDNIVTASCGVCYARYRNEEQMPAIIHLITKDLSEPYSIYTYRYFIHNWPSLCYLAIHESRYVGAIVCKLDFHKKITRRGYIAMLAVDETVRRKKIGSTLVKLAIETMADEGCDEVVLETEVTNHAALHLYEKLGFVRDKRLFRYYLNGVDALRLKLWLC